MTSGFARAARHERLRGNGAGRQERGEKREREKRRK